MSSKTKTTATKDEATLALVPKLRFPEFRGAEGWRQRQLAEITTAIFDGTHQTPTYTNEGVPFYSVENLVSGNANKFISRADYEDATKKNKPEKGDVLITRIGKIGYSQVVTWSHDFSIYVTLAVIKKDGRFNSDFLNQFIQSALYQKEILSKSLLNAVPCKINMDSLRATHVFLASPAEQRKIAECLSSVDELMAAQARKVDALKTHKKGLMQQLFAREGETQPRLRFPEFQNAGEWVEEGLDTLLHFQDGFAFKSTDFVKSKEDATQVIRITDINNHNTNGDKVYIPSAFLEANKLGKYSVDDGDLLLSLTGAAGFNFFFWDGGPSTINQRTAKVTAKKKSNRALLRLLEPLIHEKINARGEGQNNNLSKEFLSSIVLVIPEPDEQQRIADCLANLDDLIAAQTQKLEAIKTHKKGLMQQLFPSPEEIES
jgi:type I restriction enzyme S subunit